MMRVHAVVLGCKLNQAEVLESALASGWEHASFEEADRVIVHTCAVTREAERKSKKAIKRALRAGKEVQVTGCLATLEKEEFKKWGVRHVEGHDEKKLFPRKPLFERRFPFRPRAFVKIQDGCLRKCAFCIVPATRPQLFCVPEEEVITQVKAWVKAGCKEVVLTGASLGLYGLPFRSPKKALPELLKRLQGETGVPRIRLTSFDPRDVSSELLECFQKLPSLCPHLHLSLQSGDNGVLSAMERGYTSERFLELTQRLYEVNPRFSITTDIIVGFPGETGKAFERTLQLMEKARFSRCHIFPFSPRPHTQAARMAETVSPQEKKHRLKEAVILAKALEKKYAEKFLGSTQQLLVESNRDGFSRGYTPHYLYAEVKQFIPVGKMVKIKPEKYTEFLPNFKSGGLYASLCAD